MTSGYTMQMTPPYDACPSCQGAGLADWLKLPRPGFTDLPPGSGSERWGDSRFEEPYTKCDFCGAWWPRDAILPHLRKS